MTGSIGIKVQADVDWNGPTVVYVDSIILTPRADAGTTTVPGPFNFASASSNSFFVNAYQPVPNSRVDWVP
jgi:hypothetical protein